jgi:hypothetical protein
MEQQTDTPTAPEINRELERMVTSDVFLSRPRLSTLFRHIVETCLTLKGADLDSALKEHQIGTACGSGSETRHQLVTKTGQFSCVSWDRDLRKSKASKRFLHLNVNFTRWKSLVRIQ